MPWDPKPVAAGPQSPSSSSSALPSSAANGVPPASYASYDTAQTSATNGATRIKAEPGTESQYGGLSNGQYPPNPAPTQGGLARAQQLVQQQYGTAANASLNAMQQHGGLALPGQQAKPGGGGGGPAQSPTNPQQQYSQQQQAMLQRQQQQLQQQQSQTRIKVEDESPQLAQGGFDHHQQQQPNPAYSQTDGADEEETDEDGLKAWQTMLAQRRAIHAQQTQQADRAMHDQIVRLSETLQSGLMLPLDQQPSSSKVRNKKRRVDSNVQSLQSTPVHQATSSSPVVVPISQLDGNLDDDEDGEGDEEKPSIKDEDDENAINSDLDDSDDDGQGPMGDDDEEFGDNILCTYDKVQRVKNKWKCTLKDGAMNVNGKEYVFHKGMGEFEW